jgi:hypothetical protein
MTAPAGPAAALHGVMAEFDTPQALVEAAHEVRKAGYTATDAFSPFPIHGLAEALGFRERSVAPIVLAGGLTGAAVGYGRQYWTQVIAYPMNIGGRPHHSWVSFIPPTFETTVLFAAFAAVIGMLLLNGLPRPYHPVFGAERFNLASQEKFFIVIEARDPTFDLASATALLSRLSTREVVQLEE